MDVTSLESPSMPSARLQMSTAVAIKKKRDVCPPRLLKEFSAVHASGGSARQELNALDLVRRRDFDHVAQIRRHRATRNGGRRRLETNVSAMLDRHRKSKTLRRVGRLQRTGHKHRSEITVVVRVLDRNHDRGSGESRRELADHIERSIIQTGRRSLLKEVDHIRSDSSGSRLLLAERELNIHHLSSPLLENLARVGHDVRPKSMNRHAAERHALATCDLILRKKNVVLVQDLASQEATGVVVHVEGDTTLLLVGQALESVDHKVEKVRTRRVLLRELRGINVGNANDALRIVHGNANIPSKFRNFCTEALAVGVKRVLFAHVLHREAGVGTVLRIEQIRRSRIPVDQKDVRLLVFGRTLCIDDSIGKRFVLKRDDVENPVRIAAFEVAVAVEDLLEDRAGEAAHETFIRAKTEGGTLIGLAGVEKGLVHFGAGANHCGRVAHVSARNALSIPTLVECTHLAFRVGRHDLAAVTEAVIAALDHGLIKEAAVVADRMDKLAHRLIASKTFEVRQSDRIRVSHNIRHLLASFHCVLVKLLGGISSVFGRSATGVLRLAESATNAAQQSQSARMVAHRGA
nr:MAG TPA: hypothetical protein [Caudoviricetes sp.]